MCLLAPEATSAKQWLDLHGCGKFEKMFADSLTNEKQSFTYKLNAGYSTAGGIKTSTYLVEGGKK